MSHVKDKHPGYVADYEAHQRSQVGSLSVHGFVNPTAANMYRWMEWVVDRNMPLCEVGDPLARAMSKLDPVCSKTLKHYLSATAVAIKGRVIAEMDGVYGIMYDGWTCNLEHYVALIAVFLCDGKLELPLLAIVPMGEDDLTASSHCAYIRSALKNYRQSPSNLAFLMSDNCATNRAAATRFEVPLVGCASRCFNLAVNIYLDDYKDAVDVVSALMQALRTINNRAALKEQTSLSPLRPNITRWSFTFKMVERYVCIQDQIKQVEAVFDLIPKAAMHQRIEALLEDLRIFDSVTVALQSDDHSSMRGPCSTRLWSGFRL